MTLFNLAYQSLKAAEGGFSNNPNDDGGPTNLGITQVTLGAWLLSHGRSVFDVKDLDGTTARLIYLEMFWQPFKIDELHAALAFPFFHITVNSGFDDASKILQRSLNHLGHELLVDGVAGSKTKRASNQLMGSERAEPLINELYARWAQHYGQHRDFLHFGLGWMRRVSTLHATSLQLVNL